MDYSRVEPVKKSVPAVSSTKIVSGKVVEKSKKRRFFDELFAEDMHEVKEHVVWDVILPAIKKGLRNTLVSIVDSIFGISSSSKESSVPAARINYRATSESRTNVNVGSSDRRDLLFSSRSDAEAVLNAMEEAIASYGIVSIGDYYNFAGVDNSPSDYNYGWTSLESAKIKIDPDGYVISFPRAMRLD